MKYVLYKQQGSCEPAINKIYSDKQTALNNMLKNYRRYLNEIVESGAIVVEQYQKDNECYIRYKQWSSEGEWKWFVKEE